MLTLPLPYITPDLPGIGGQLRAVPADFTVAEIPLYEASGEGQHLYIQITKENMTTRDVQQGLARIFGVANQAVGFAGMKDKHARTTQTFSVNVAHVDADFVAAAPERIQAALPVQVDWVKLHRNKLKTGHLLGNRFRIVISGLEMPGEQALDRAQAIAQAIRERGLPNYYGPQRLGQDGLNVSRGLGLIRRERRMQDRWLRNLLMASVQSYLCNRYLARRLEEGRYAGLLLGDIAKKYETGGLFEVADLAADQPRYEAWEISFTAPIFGPKMWEATGEAAFFEQSILAELDLSLADLGKAGLTGTRRLGRLRLDDLAVELDEDGLAVHFSLPKGAFATTLLREMMKVDDDRLGTLPEEE